MCDFSSPSRASCCSLIWMFCSKIGNNKINKIHRRTLRTICLNDETSLYKLLEIGNSEIIQSRHIKVLLAEILKSLSTILDINYVDFLQFQRYFIPQAELDEAFIYIIRKPIDFSIGHMFIELKQVRVPIGT